MLSHCDVKPPPLPQTIRCNKNKPRLARVSTTHLTKKYQKGVIWLRVKVRKGSPSLLALSQVRLGRESHRQRARGLRLEGRKRFAITNEARGFLGVEVLLLFFSPVFFNPRRCSKESGGGRRNTRIRRRRERHKSEFGRWSESSRFGEDSEVVEKSRGGRRWEVEVMGEVR